MKTIPGRNGNTAGPISDLVISTTYSIIHGFRSSLLPSTNPPCHARHPAGREGGRRGRGRASLVKLHHYLEFYGEKKTTTK